MLQKKDTGSRGAEEIMSLDAKLLRAMQAKDAPILHLYRWAGPSATYGHFIDPKKHLDLDFVQRYRLNLARRPTGGGIVFHIWDLAFSFLMPAGHPKFSTNTLENYRFVNQIVLEAVREVFSVSFDLIPQNAPSLGPDCQNFCMAKPTQYDVIHQGMKIAGAAQRRGKQGYLHQGTISLAFPQLGLLRDCLLSKEAVLQAMQAYTFAPLGRVWEPKQLNDARTAVEEKLFQKFQAIL